LEDYPEGSFLNECIQNADDCGAKEVKLCISSKNFGVSQLVTDKLASFQGAALYVYNDSVFADKDFENIKHLGNSLKKTDLQATGQFGLGINSIYHMSDLLTIASRDTLLILDPNEYAFEGAGNLILI
jgi:sacsin